LGYIKEDLPVDQRVMFPAINPLSEKNRDIPDRLVAKMFEKAGIPTDKPIIAQVSRLDPWKDPEGVVDVYRRVREKIDCRLVLCYNIASDDPEGYRMYNKVYRKAEGLTRKGDVLFVVGNNETLVNAVQRRADVIIQKSIREGFCLAVTEALWKETPVVASAVGGIPLQIDDGNSGFLLDPMDNQGFADRIIHLLRDKKLSQHIGKQAREKVHKQFLITRLLSDHLDMLNSLLA
jgi:trehalose synthase